ncbi:MAG: hypothetical protein AAGC55_23860 [Myxococcota bacterium]
MHRIIPSAFLLSTLGCFSGSDAQPEPTAPSDTAGAASSEPAPAAPLLQFPGYTAADLNGRTVKLPGQAPGQPTLMLVAFKQRQQALVDGWLAAVEPVLAEFPGLDYTELPVIRQLNQMSRWYLDRAMRRGIPETYRRARVVTLYVDKERFRSQLDIPHEDTVYLFLVEQGGGILWRSSGQPSDGAVREMRRVMTAHRAAQARL